MSELSLYNLNKDMLDLKSLAYNDEIDEETFLNTFESMQIAVEDKVEACGYVIAMLEGDAEKCKNEKEHINTIQKIFENRAKRLKESIKKCMETAELKEIKGGRFTAKICNAGGSAKLSVDENAVPMDYMKMTFTPDLDKIKDDLNKGIKLDFARYEPKTTYLKIK